VSLSAGLERLYRQFSVYPAPEVWVCEQCGPEWSAAEIGATPLRSLSLPQLVAVHVMALDDDALRYYFPRLMELMLQTPSPVFDFRLADLKSRLHAWESGEKSAVKQLAEAVWTQLSASYPAELGYFSDCPSALDLLDWSGLPLAAHLDSMVASDSLSAARHLADLLDAVFTMRAPFETASRTRVLAWLENPVVGERLQSAFFVADSDETARQLSAAYDLWAVCARQGLR
jgi:hypothetical protein